MQICQYQCHDMSNSFLHIGMYARFFPFPKYLNHDMNHLFLQDSIYERCHMSSKLTAVLDLLDIKVSFKPCFIYARIAANINPFFSSEYDRKMNRGKKVAISSQQKTKRKKKAAVCIHCAFLPKRSQSLCLVIITGSCWSVGTCGQG